MILEKIPSKHCSVWYAVHEQVILMSLSKMTSKVLIGISRKDFFRALTESTSDSLNWIICFHWCLSATAV